MAKRNVGYLCIDCKVGSAFAAATEAEVEAHRRVAHPDLASPDPTVAERVRAAIAAPWTPDGTAKFADLPVDDLRALLALAESAARALSTGFGANNGGCTRECLFHAARGNVHSTHCEQTRSALATARQLGLLTGETDGK